MRNSTVTFLGVAYRFVVVFSLAGAVLPLAAQSTGAASASQAGVQAPLRFEVASIRPHAPNGDEPSNRRMMPGGRFVATATPLRTLMRIAFGADDVRIVEGSKLADEMYDVDAITVDHREVKKPEEFQELILSLLVERFGMKFHLEEKVVPVYWLEVEKPGKLGPALRASAPDAEANMSMNSNGARTEMKVTKMSMVDIAAGLRRQAGRPVEDHTELKGNYDFQIEWSPEQAADATDPGLYTVLKEQLGLRLKPAKGTTQAVVIDSISAPTAN